MKLSKQTINILRNFAGINTNLYISPGNTLMTVAANKTAFAVAEVEETFDTAFGGCDVGCIWCDVKDSWDASKHPVISVDEIVAKAVSYPGRLAVITGGEPLLHKLDILTESLHAVGFETNMETSGSSPLSVS